MARQVAVNLTKILFMVLTSVQCGVRINLEVFEEQLSLFCFHKTQMTSTRKITQGPYSGVLKSPVKNSFMAN